MSESSETIRTLEERRTKLHARIHHWTKIETAQLGQLNATRDYLSRLRKAHSQVDRDLAFLDGRHRTVQAKLPKSKKEAPPMTMAELMKAVEAGALSREELITLSAKIGGMV
jgi:chromosome segregation ATPase